MNSISNGVACHHGSRLLGGGRYCSLRGGGRMVLELLRAAPNYQPVPGLILWVPGECPQGPGPSLGIVSHRVLCSSEVLPRSYLVSYSGGWLLRTGGREAEGAPEKRGCRSHLPLVSQPLSSYQVCSCWLSDVPSPLSVSAFRLILPGVTDLGPWLGVPCSLKVKTLKLVPTG